MIENLEEANKRLHYYESRYGPYQEAKGWKSLFRMPVGNEWVILIMVICAIIMGFAYMNDLQTCTVAVNYYNQMHAITSGNYGNLKEVIPILNGTK